MGEWTFKENKKAIIFYFTGTGNSLYVAKEISKSFSQCDIVAIPQAVENKEFDYKNHIKNESMTKQFFWLNFVLI